MEQYFKSIFATLLLIFCCYCGITQAPKITAAEYYVDNDPGYGKGTKVALGSLPDNSFTFDITKLVYGTHLVGLRTQDSTGIWSLDNKWVFIKFLEQAKRPPGIKSAEYYINNDPGYGNGTAITISNNANEGQGDFTLDATQLPYGTTVVGLRSQDDNGVWGLDNKWLIVKVPPLSPTKPLIDSAEYYIDADPGYGKGTPITLTPAQQLDGLSFTIDLTKVHSGHHTIAVRSKDANQAWGLDNKLLFIGGSSLPLTLLSFSGEVVKVDEAQLLWTTVSEVNTKQFIVQRSKNGAVFDSIGTVAAVGNSVARLNYSFTDAAPLNGVNYYRLKMQDLDGAFSYSGVVPLLINGGVAKALSIYPNPASSTLTVSFNAVLAGEYTIQLTDLTGREIERINGVSSVGVNNVRVDVHNYATGTYLITLTDKEHGKQSLSLNRL